MVAPWRGFLLTLTSSALFDLNQNDAACVVIWWTDGNGVMASRADEYRCRAQQCLEMAAAFSDRNSRLAPSHMAQAWLGLAERSDFIAPVTTECAQHVVQQQQQVQPKQGQRGRPQCPRINSKSVRA